MSSSSGGEERGQGFWSLLPSFDPAQDNVREYVEKVKFLAAICPDRDKGMLAPRLAMLCKGTAWGQVKAISPEKLTDKDNGVNNLLAALSSWEESAEMKTYEVFEKAIYKTTQKADESTTSFVNRLQVAMDELGSGNSAGISCILAPSSECVDCGGQKTCAHNDRWDYGNSQGGTIHAHPGNISPFSRAEKEDLPHELRGNREYESHSG